MDFDFHITPPEGTSDYAGNTVVDSNGCRPATSEERVLWAECVRLRREVAALQGENTRLKAELEQNTPEAIEESMRQATEKLGW